ncbi:MAG TPA: hypothetical protein VH280_15835 [Verrucomicrobiae bacterium]|nr:hypothetical protein [Verrucomicrobiae bacterium]
MNYLEQLEEILKLADGQDAFQRLVSLFLQGPEEARDLIRAKWDFGYKWIYANMQRLACQKNERYSCGERLLAALVYDAIENMKMKVEDWRDKLVGWSVVYHSCLAARIVPEELFTRAVSVSAPSMAQMMMDFINRPEEAKSMKAFDLVSRTNSDGEIEIKPSWHIWWEKLGTI